MRRLGELGWTDGRTVAIEYRWAEGRSERFAEIAAEFVRLQVDVIVTVGGAALAARQVTPTIPIVFAAATDPLGGGLVASLARPGGNTTGLSMQASDAAGKRLELLREVLPGVRRLAVMGNVGYPATVQEIAEVRAAAGTLGLDLDHSFCTPSNGSNIVNKDGRAPPAQCLRVSAKHAAATARPRS